MRTDKDPRRGRNRDYIPNDEIDREEKADIRQQKKGNVVSVILGGIVVISLIAFLFVLLDSGVLTGEAQRLYGSPQASENAGSGELTQEEKKAAEEEARKAEEEAKEKKRQEEEAKRAEEEAAQKAKQEEEEKAREEEERKKAEERAEKQAEIDEKEAKRKKELEEEQKVLSGDYILPDSNSRYYSRKKSPVSPTGKSCSPSMRSTPVKAGYSPEKNSRDTSRARAGTTERFLRRNLTPTRMSASMNTRRRI